ncbi:MAG: DNA translocase FtsK 4TM domain-containing protein [Kofleriaceae bacterium]
MAKNRKIKVASAKPGGTHRRREVLGVLGVGVALFLLASLASLQAGKLVMGPFGRATGLSVYGIAGMTSYVAVILLTVASIRALIERDPILPPEVVLGTTLGMISLATLVHLGAGHYRVAGHGPGGVIGEHLAEICRAAISTAGTTLLAMIGLLVAIVVATPVRMRDVLTLGHRGLAICGAALAAAAFAVWRFLGDVGRGILPDRDRDLTDDELDEVGEELDVLELAEDERKGAEPAIFERAPAVAFVGDTERVDARPAEAEPKRKRRSRGNETTELDLPVAAEVIELEPKKPRRRLASGTKAPEADAGDDAAAAEPGPVLAESSAPAAAAMVPAAAGPVIVEPKFRHADRATMAAKEKAADAERQTFIKLGEGEYQLPSIQLLAYDASSQNALDKGSMLELSARLAQTLENYGVKGEVVAIRPGPVVTMYEFAPAPGTRVNKIVNLTDDLALALEALRVRIVAPIPGKAAVGIEVPNRTREKVFLKEIIADDSFRKGRSKLPMALGKDIEGGPAVVDLAKMPHLLVAGTTGSGKSVAVNAMITSLLYHCSPEEVRMIMVDPKMLELSIYEGVPHLLLPVVTDPKKANLALRWAVEEMDKRYDLLAQMGVRDIAGYNEKVAKLEAKREADQLRRAAEAAEAAVAGAEDDAGSTDEADAAGAEDGRARAAHDGPSDRQVVAPPRQKLPYIVVVIDEFADLMMCAPKEVETSVARIAQKARASGIHLILATQRPSVDVITGLIKANFPSRIAFHVTSKIDSRTILDQTGAEALLGAGDMLFSDRGAAPRRLHGCYVDEEEIQRVVNFLKTQGRPVYNLDILKPRDEEEQASDGGGGASGGKSDDDMYDRAVHIVTTTRNASISWVQRQLRIGYNRAARLVEEMEKQGVVSPPDHTNKREVMTAA